MHWSHEGQNPNISHEPCQDLHLYTVQRKVNEILRQDNPVEKGIFMLPEACTDIPSVAVVPKAKDEFEPESTDWKHGWKRIWQTPYSMNHCRNNCNPMFCFLDSLFIGEKKHQKESRDPRQETRTAALIAHSPHPGKHPGSNKDDALAAAIKNRQINDEKAQEKALTLAHGHLQRSSSFQAPMEGGGRENPRTKSKWSPPVPNRSSEISC